MWQVFNFLFNLIDAEQAKQEFRDCWPILDKKQVAVLVPLPFPPLPHGSSVCRSRVLICRNRTMFPVSWFNLKYGSWPSLIVQAKKGRYHIHLIFLVSYNNSLEFTKTWIWTKIVGTNQKYQRRHTTRD